MDERKRSKIYCCVPQCRTYYSEHVSFHNFPKTDKILRYKWIHALKIRRTVSPYMRVCNKHFKDEDFFFNRRHVNKIYRLKSNVVPSQNLPKGLDEKRFNEMLMLKKLKKQQMKEENSKDIFEDEGQPQLISVHNKCEIDVAEALLSLSHTK